MAHPNKDNNDIDWYANQVVTDKVPIIDPAEGRPIIIKEFRYQINPNVFLPSKQILFNAAWPRIKEILWAEGLEANQDQAPRVIVGKYAYMIYIVCEVRGGRVRAGRMKDKAKNINEVLKKIDKK